MRLSLGSIMYCITSGTGEDKMRALQVPMEVDAVGGQN